jgi:hypothetical protein
MAHTTDALLSDDRLFRYWLLRQWNAALRLMAVIGCNPSKADESTNDPTIRKVMGFAERMDFGGVLMLNVGAFRATDPKDWKGARDPFGPGNTIDHLHGYLFRWTPSIVVAAWGKPCMASQRGQHRAEAIKGSILGMKCWGRNSDGSPRHPLMLPYSTKLEPFN